MTTVKRAVAVGVFEDRQQAQRAVDELRRIGFRDDQIGVAARNGETIRGASNVRETGSKAEEGAVAGALTGAAVGGLWGIGIAAGLLPAIGPVIAGGTLAAILASAATGAAVATIVGALVGMGIPEEEAKYYESEFKSGRVIVTVRADNRYDEAMTILRRFNAYDITNRKTVTASTATGYTGATATTGSMASARAGEQTVKVHEEQLNVHKQPVQAGEVRVRKEGVTEHKTLEVPVQREEVVIERRPVSGQACSSEIRAGEEIRIPVKEEQVHVEKQAVVKEEVKVGKRQVQDTEQVHGTVRKEQVRIEREGDVDVRGSTADIRHDEEATDLENAEVGPRRGVFKTPRSFLLHSNLNPH